MSCCRMLQLATYAASDFVRGTRAAVVRRGTVEVAALARGLSVRVKDAIVVVGVEGLSEKAWISFVEWVV